MRLAKIGLTAVLSLVATLTISDFPFIRNPQSPIQNSQVLAQTPDARTAKADRLLLQGLEQLQSSYFEEALQSFQQALAIYREVKDRKREGVALGNLGLAYFFLGNYSKTIDYQQRWLAIAREIKDRQGEGKALGNLGVAYRNLGNYTKAIDYFQQVLAIAKGIQDRQSEEAALANLGVAYLNLGDHTKAIDYLQQALTIVRGIQDRRGEGAALGNLGLAYSYLGDYATAINYFQQSLAIAQGIQDRRGEGAALGNLGLVYSHLGDYAKAFDYTQQTLAIARAIQERQREGLALGNLGELYSSLGDYPRAIDYTQQALAIAREIKDRQGEGVTLLILGKVYVGLEDYAKAINYTQQALAIARGIQDRQSEAKALANLGVVYLALGEYTQTIDYTQQGLTIAQQIKERDSEGLVLNNLGFALYKQGHLTRAEQTLIGAMKVRELIRAGLGSNDANKVSIFEIQAATYHHLQQVLIAQKKTDVALEIAERGRARAFVELLANRLSSNSTEQPSITPPNINQIKQIAKAQKATLVQYSITYDLFKAPSQQQFKESELYIWIIKPTGEITFRSSDLKPLWQRHNTTLTNLVAGSRESIGVRGRGLGVAARVDGVTPTQPLQQLHQLLIQPIADLLPTNPNERVIFIPQASLFLVPFPALQDKDGNYLIEKHTILTAPSIQVLDLTHKQRQRVETTQASTLQGNDALVVGNPTMPSVSLALGEKPKQLPSLPGAEKEAEAIAPLLNTKAIIGKDATKSAIEQLMPKARIIHLATHGLLDDIRGIGSAIALAPSGTDDGLLKAEEIFDMKLKAELVVLSACDTGRGRITGDGVIGLSRSLISAGVPSVLVSLWSVPDAPTAELMSEFYRNLQQNSDKAQALRQAMLTTLKQHPNPRDWAAFTLIGEAE